MRKCVLCHMQTIKAQISLLRLISTFVVHCLDSRICICYIQSFKIPASFCSWSGWFESYLVENLRRQVFTWCGSCGSGPNYVEVSRNSIKGIYDVGHFDSVNWCCLWRFKACGHWYWLWYGYQPTYWTFCQWGNLQGLSTEIWPYYTGHIVTYWDNITID